MVAVPTEPVKHGNEDQRENQRKARAKQWLANQLRSCAKFRPDEIHGLYTLRRMARRICSLRRLISAYLKSADAGERWSNGGSGGIVACKRTLLSAPIPMDA